MSKIVYLLGAGASFGKRGKEVLFSRDASRVGHVITKNGNYPIIEEGLPLVTEIPSRIEYIISVIKDVPYTQYSERRILPLGSNSGTGIETAKEMLIKDLEWLAKESARHATVDTFARKLFLTGKSDDFTKLKGLLSLYFIIEQIINKTDNRYDTFLANVLEINNRIDKKITILSWNYDSQYEIALKEYYSGIISPSDAGVCSMYDTEENECKNPQMFKINGSASFKELYSLGKFCNDSKSTLDEGALVSLLNLYVVGDKSLLTFAWEHSNVVEPSHYNIFHNKLRESIKDAKVLVVIGYTFPFFNRRVDRQIFSYMDSLKSIYIQDPKCDAVKQNIGSVLYDSNVDIITLSNVDQFFLPPEL